MGLTVAVRNATLDSIFGGVYISLHTGNPGTNGANEVTGGSYARQLETFAAAASGEIANASDIEFEDMPAVTVSYWGIWSAASAGTFYGGWLLTAPVAVVATQLARFLTGSLVVEWPDA